ncbi:MAG: hypothetical protein ACLFPL_03080 [Candidatus Nanoarchaeia archaeon]
MRGDRKINFEIQVFDKLEEALEDIFPNTLRVEEKEGKEVSIFEFQKLKEYIDEEFLIAPISPTSDDDSGCRLIHSENMDTSRVENMTIAMSSIEILYDLKKMNPTLFNKILENGDIYFLYCFFFLGNVGMRLHDLYDQFVHSTNYKLFRDIDTTFYDPLMRKANSICMNFYLDEDTYFNNFSKLVKKFRSISNEIDDNCISELQKTRNVYVRADITCKEDLSVLSLDVLKPNLNKEHQIDFMMFY